MRPQLLEDMYRYDPVEREFPKTSVDIHPSRFLDSDYTHQSMDPCIHLHEQDFWTAERVAYFPSRDRE